MAEICPLWPTRRKILNGYVQQADSVPLILNSGDLKFVGEKWGYAEVKIYTPY